MKVLIVDDEESGRNLLASFLSRKKDLRFCLAENGSQGLELFQIELPDLVITDIEMPLEGGIEMAQKIRAGGSDVPIIFISGDIESHIHRLKEFTSFETIQKPSPLSEYSKKIETLCQ